MRRSILICYDIADPKRLDKVRDAVKDYGTRIQFSIYQCELTPTDLARIRETLRDLIHRQEDCVLFIDLGGVETPGTLSSRIETLGRKPQLNDPNNLVF